MDATGLVRHAGTSAVTGMTSGAEPLLAGTLHRRATSLRTKVNYLSPPPSPLGARKRLRSLAMCMRLHRTAAGNPQPAPLPSRGIGARPPNYLDQFGGEILDPVLQPAHRSPRLWSRRLPVAGSPPGT
jgi:hypothetical protein